MATTIHFIGVDEWDRLCFYVPSTDRYWKTVCILINESLLKADPNGYLNAALNDLHDYWPGPGDKLHGEPGFPIKEETVKDLKLPIYAFSEV